VAEEVAVEYIERISIAVFDVVKAESDYCRLFGWDVLKRYTDTDLHINVSCFAVGPTIVEFMEGGDEWYELRDNDDNPVTAGKGSETRWVLKEKPLRERDEYAFGVQMISLKVDQVPQAVACLKGNGAAIIGKSLGRGKEIQYWRSQDLYQAFIHPQDTRGVYWRVIGGGSEPSSE
jgi:catechol 2,3-dioxygenase-like lactoylglutathione lyase family enzyme